MKTIDELHLEWERQFHDKAPHIDDGIAGYAYMVVTGQNVEESMESLKNLLIVKFGGGIPLDELMKQLREVP